MAGSIARQHKRKAKQDSKDDFRKALRAYGEKINVDPHFWMYDLIKRKGVSNALKLQAAKELAQYLEPKLKALEVSGNAANPLLIESPTERQTRIDALLKKREKGA